MTVRSASGCPVIRALFFGLEGPQKDAQKVNPNLEQELNALKILSK